VFTRRDDPVVCGQRHERRARRRDALRLISRADFAKDAQFGAPHGTGFPGIGLIHLAQAPDEVARILATAVAAAGRLGSSPAPGSTHTRCIRSAMEN